MSPHDASNAARNLIENERAGRAVLVVAIDGGVGVGKSTLARAIRDQLGSVTILRADHFFRPLLEYPAWRLSPEERYRLCFPWERMRDEALLPLRQGRTARYQRYDWEIDRLGQWIVVEPNRTIVVEGTYSSRPELRPLIDVAIFVDTPREERVTRILARGYLARDPGNAWLTPWMVAENWYFANLKPAKLANLIVSGAGPGGEHS